MLDLEFIRSAFPALDTTRAHLDNANRTLLPNAVIDRITEAMRRATSAQETTEILIAAHDAAAEWIGADRDEVVL
ncbi:MAG TPA: hypothetical protein ENK31_06790, partial [Nannocystis exedens]|nr:hypothetical protein [Nannocystis exedens]